MARTSTDTPVVDLAAIVAAAPASATRRQSLSDMTDFELNQEFETVQTEGNALRDEASSPSRNGKLAANTTRIKQIVDEARTRLAARETEAA
jgi:hypothetical protein